MPPAKCIATVHRTGQRCRRWPIAGGRVCPTHGGSKNAVKAAAQRRLAEQEAEAMVSRMDLGPVDNPLLELKKLAARALAWEALFEEKRQSLIDWRYTNGSGEQLRAEVAVVERAMDRCATILGLIAKLNLDERIVRLEEAKAAMVEQLVLAVFRDLALTDDQISAGRTSLGRRLRAVTA